MPLPFDRRHDGSRRVRPAPCGCAAVSLYRPRSAEPRAPTFEQCGTELVLEPSHPPGDGRRVDSERLGGMREVAGGRGCLRIYEITDLDVRHALQILTSDVGIGSRGLAGRRVDDKLGTRFRGLPRKHAFDILHRSYRTRAGEDLGRYGSARQLDSWNAIMPQGCTKVMSRCNVAAGSRESSVRGRAMTTSNTSSKTNVRRSATKNRVQ
jgi:hypothetical protein